MLEKKVLLPMGSTSVVQYDTESNLYVCGKCKHTYVHPVDLALHGLFAHGVKI